MIILLVALLCLLFFHSRLLRFNDGYLSRTQTDSWKGFFAVLILFSHMLGYMTVSHPLDDAFRDIVVSIGQLVVVMFLFYSGYGVLESWRHKDGYDRRFLRHRLLPLLIHFDIAVLLFVLLGWALGRQYPLRNYLFCWVGWESVGNSNWFVFDILALYVIAQISFLLARKSRFRHRDYAVLLATTLLTVALWATMRYGFASKGSRWYNTLCAFPLGMAFSCVRGRVEAFVAKAPDVVRWLLIGATLVALAVCLPAKDGDMLFNLKVCFFALLVVLASVKLQIGNEALVWLGRNCFALYILQRLPMMLLSHVGLNTSSPYLFVALSIASALLLAWAFTAFLHRFDKAVLRQA